MAPLDLEHIYRHHGHVVLRRARSILRSESDALEVLQDVFTSLLERPEQFRGESSITTFLYKKTTNMCLNKLRNHKKRTSLLQEEARGSAPMAVDSPERRALAKGLLSSLPEKLARVAVHYYIDEMTHDEIATIEGCSRRNVGKLLDKIQRELQAEAA